MHLNNSKGRFDVRLFEILDHILDAFGTIRKVAGGQFLHTRDALKLRDTLGLLTALDR